MTQPISDLKLMISGMEPVLNPGTYAYASIAHGVSIEKLHPVATMREVEGLTVIVAEQEAEENGLTILYRCAWITLNVHSDLNACGLTAAFAKALADATISCNVVAGAFHDHIFVPVDLAQSALTALKQLQQL